jgi:hypothetical protein
MCNPITLATYALERPPRSALSPDIHDGLQPAL